MIRKDKDAAGCLMESCQGVEFLVIWKDKGAGCLMESCQGVEFLAIRRNKDV